MTRGGELQFLNSDVDFDIYNGGGFLPNPRLMARFDTYLHASAQVSATGQATCTAKVAAVWFPVQIGPVTVIVEVGPKISAKFNGAATLTGTLGGPITLGFDAGLGGTEDLSSNGVQLSSQATADASLAVPFGGYVAFKAFGVAGIELSAGPKWKGEFSSWSTPCLSVRQSLSVSGSIFASAWKLKASDRRRRRLPRQESTRAMSATTSP